MWRWRQYGEPKRHVPYADALKGADLREVHDLAVRELIHGAIAGAPPAHLTKVAALVLAAERRLERAP